MITSHGVLSSETEVPVVFKITGSRDDACVDPSEVNEKVLEYVGAPGIESYSLAIAKGGKIANMCTAGADGLCRTSCGTPLGKVVNDDGNLDIEVSNKHPVDTAAECGDELSVLCDSTLTYLLAIFV